MKKFLFGFLVMLGGALGAIALDVGAVSAHTGSPALTVWSTGQTLTSSALNDSFAHLHNTLTGGITNANISASAAIDGTKINLGTSNRTVRAWAYVAPTCSAGTCALADSVGVTSVAYVSTGVYDVTLSSPPANANFAVMISYVGFNTDQVMASCFTNDHNIDPGSPSHFRITCSYWSTASALPAISNSVAISLNKVNGGFNFIVMDT